CSGLFHAQSEPVRPRHISYREYAAALYAPGRDGLERNASSVMVLGNDRSPVAVVDIGSNSVRLIGYESAGRAPAPLFNEKGLCGLGRTIATTGRLASDPIVRALRALRRFRALIEQLGVSHVEVIATAAAREAGNGPEFIAQAERVLGWPITVLSGTREAEL